MTAGFTAEERDAVRLVAHGFDNPTIARAMGLKTHQVSLLLRAAMAKVHARNRTHLVALAFRVGALDGEDVQP